jgi:hypothetical protein
MTDKELENLFSAFVNPEEVLQAKNKISNILAARQAAKPVLRFLLPVAAAAAIALFVFFYAHSEGRKNTWEPKMEYVSVYDSPMYVYLINAVYEENNL